MKKIIAILLAVLLIVALAVPAYAVTPALKVPDLPEIPDISDDVSVELSDDFWDKYFKDRPITTTEPEAENLQLTPGWREWLRVWYLRWADLFRSDH